MLLGAGFDEPGLLEALDRITADCALAPALMKSSPRTKAQGASGSSASAWCKSDQESPRASAWKVIMADQGGTKTVRVPALVKVEDVHMWLTRFMTFAVVERISQAVQMKQDPDLPANESDHIDASLIVHKPVRCEDEGSIHAAIARVLGRAKLTKLRLVGFGFTDGERNGSGSFQAIAEGINVSTTLAELAIEDCFFGEKSTELLKGLRIGTLAIGRVELAEPLGARRLFQAILDPRSTIKHVSLLRGCEFYHVQTFMPLVRDSKLESLEIDLGRGNKNLFTLVEQIPQMMIKALQFCIDGATEHDRQPVLQVGRQRLLEAFRRNMTIESLTITSYDHARNFWSSEERLLLQSYAEENRDFNLLLREAGAMGDHVWPERIAAVNQRRNDSSTALFLAVKALAPNRGAFRFGHTRKRASTGW